MGLSYNYKAAKLFHLCLEMVNFPNSSHILYRTREYMAIGQLVMKKQMAIVIPTLCNCTFYDYDFDGISCVYTFTCMVSFKTHESS